MPLPKTLPGEEVLLSSSAFPLKGIYAPTTQEGRPTLILLHMLGGNKETWLSFAQALQKGGYGYLAYDARGHGQSQRDQEGQEASFRRFRSSGTDNEWNQMVQDADAAIEFLQGQGIPSHSIAIAGASMGANVGLLAATHHPEIAFAILLSPSLNYRDVLTVSAMGRYGRRPLLILSSPKDKYAHKGSSVLNAIAQKTSGKEMVQHWTVPSGHGLRMLNPSLIAKILNWISLL